MRLAAIDLGTNTALLLIAEVIDGQLRPCYEAEQFVRLGEGLERTGMIGPAALMRLRRTLEAYRERLRAYGVKACWVAATSATREARNAQEVVRIVREVLGVAAEIISGEEEAYWSLQGALAAPGMPHGPCLVVDIGGGSTELVGGARQPDGTVTVGFARSLPLGTVRLTERWFASLPPSPEAIMQAQHQIREALAAVRLPRAATHYALVGVAGTCVSLAALETRSFPVESSVALTYDAVATWRDRLLKMSAAAVRALWPELLAGRADVLPMGALLLHEIMTWGRWRLCRVSPFGLRHGLILRHLPRC
ncbi:Ppx/GppA phosphatase family protein [Rhodothermus profundi]|uniref:Exopolyphosphatase / guanosine-5'-triphosphate,3'-diphosphate pyrophosphatase n=1 Tax=Rhodothermus profundi TaxID=633813 RepID=A0A1M6VDR2_9BACT|nr:exopolyphosphatase [Rhodothermus profundi]SHK79663.1 exopolyphosphatase / guanosine-5'-triphosphate,3'-diphosphate pyrophosphatase [Rhodothermus profundi]